MPTQNSGTPAEGSLLRAAGSLVLGLGLMAVAVSGALPSSSQAAAAPQPKPLLVATRALPAGATLAVSDVAMTNSPEGSGTAQIGAVVGRRLVVTLAAGDVIQSAELADPGAAVVPRRLISIAADARLVPAAMRAGDDVQVVRAGDDLRAAVVVGPGRIVDISGQAGGSAPLTITVDTDAATALAIAGTPGGAVLRLVGLAPT